MVSSLAVTDLSLLLSVLSHISLSLPPSPLPPPRVDSSGRNGLQYVVKVILHLLDPSRPEFSAAFVGKLLITFVKKVSLNCL